ncbi:MAG: TetR family transcriptional regulator [Alphaproteobacteria bacterium]|nr:MAG: TetR family transcriptional regulator [Alphaproteobacteria bacterium]
MTKICCPLARKSYHHGNLRKTLIDSALEILEEGTLADLSLRALARKAGVSQTAPYRHFEDKEALIAVLIEEGMRKLGQAMMEIMAMGIPPVERLQKLGMRYVEFSEACPAHFKVMFEYELDNYEKYCALHEVSSQGFQCLRDTVLECLALPNARDIDPAVAQFSAWSMVHGLSVLLMNQSLMTHVKTDHLMTLGEKHQIAEQVTKLFSISLIK